MIRCTLFVLSMKETGGQLLHIAPLKQLWAPRGVSCVCFHVLHSKHAVFYGRWCRRWGKAKIQAVSAEVIRFVTDSLWNVLLLKAWCPGTSALSHVDPHSHTHTHIFHAHNVHPRVVDCTHIVFVAEADTKHNSKHNTSGILAHTWHTYASYELNNTFYGCQQPQILKGHHVVSGEESFNQKWMIFIDSFGSFLNKLSSFSWLNELKNKKRP